MAFRTVIISSYSKVEYSLEYLIFRTIDGEKRIHMDEISTIVFETTNISVTSRALIELVQRKVNIIFCDQQHNPFAQLNPLYGSHDGSKKIKIQLEWNDEIKNYIWKEIIEHKIRGQSCVLQKYGRLKENFYQLDKFSKSVETGDITNREGHAAKVYFNSLFNERFSREEDNDINAMLNYGYSILLSLFNRGICSLGYLTQCGIHHKNEFNHFNFSCDLMEPYRPFVDALVAKLYLTKQLNKEKMLELFNFKVIISGSSQTLVNSINIYLNSIISSLNGSMPVRIKFPGYDGL